MSASKDPDAYLETPPPGRVPYIHTPRFSVEDVEWMRGQRAAITSTKHLNSFIKDIKALREDMEHRGQLWAGPVSIIFAVVAVIAGFVAAYALWELGVSMTEYLE